MPYAPNWEQQEREKSDEEKREAKPIFIFLYTHETELWKVGP
jgi:hypothetical protein